MVFARSPRTNSIKAGVLAGIMLMPSGCVTDGTTDLDTYGGPPFSYVEPRPLVTQKYVYDCKRTKLGGEYCTPRAAGQPFGYNQFIPY